MGFDFFLGTGSVCSSNRSFASDSRSIAGSELAEGSLYIKFAIIVCDLCAIVLIIVLDPAESDRLTARVTEVSLLKLWVT